MDENEETIEVQPKKKYTVSFSIKLPIANVPYSSVQSMISVSGDEYDQVKEEAMEKLEKQTLDILNEVNGVFSDY